ncbi:hypothetical protein K501DRAFT_236489 [Backusella circina FSU 941]|nr:hypothetical protein K501DRAFT_236489 [Backusella circina FSU 941]
MSVPHQLAQQFLELQNEQDIQTIIKDQQQCLEIYKSSQQKLEAFNNFSKARYQDVHKHFEVHTKLLKEMRGDLNNVFTKLQKIKRQLAQQYPQEMQIVQSKYPPPTVDDEEE